MMFAERRGAPRYHLLTRAGVSVRGKTHWGSLVNLSRTGVALSLPQSLKPNQKVTVRVLLQGEGGGEVTEFLSARVIWTAGDKAGLELDPPLKARSPALLRAPCLAAYLEEKEGGG
jgi:hypothetical protein